MLNFERYAAGSRVPIEDVKKLVGGTWQNVEEVYANESGQWVVVWRRTPPIPDITDLDNLEFTKYSGGGRVFSASGQSMNLLVQDSDYTGSTPNSHYVVYQSRPIMIPNGALIRFSYYMDGNWHDPFFWLTTISGSAAYPLSPDIGGALYTKDKTLCEWSIGKKQTPLTIYLGLRTGNGTHSGHITYCYLSGLTINGKPVAWR